MDTNHIWSPLDVHPAAWFQPGFPIEFNKTMNGNKYNILCNKCDSIIVVCSDNDLAEQVLNGKSYCRECNLMHNDYRKEGIR